MSVTALDTPVDRSASTRNGVMADGTQAESRASTRNVRLAALLADLEAEEADIRLRAGQGDEHAKWLRSIPSAPLTDRAKHQLVSRSRECAAWCAGCGRDLAADEPVWHDHGGACGECCARTYREFTAQRCEACGRVVHYWRGQSGRRGSRHPACCELHRLQAITARRRDARSGARADRTCLACDATFTPPRSDARYCSPACRQKAYRKRTTTTRSTA